MKSHKKNKNLDMKYGEKNKMKDTHLAINKVQNQYPKIYQNIIIFETLKI